MTVLLVALLLLGMVIHPEVVKAATTAPQNDRLFYFSTFSSGSSGPRNSLSISSPATSAQASSANISRSSLSFAMQSPLLAPVSLSGGVVFNLWINSSGPARVSGSFDYLLPGTGSFWNNISLAAPYAVGAGFSAANFTLQVGEPPLTYGTQLAISINATTTLPRGNITLYWGAVQAPSHVTITLSQYETMPPPNPVAILDRSGNPTTYFTLSNNIVLVEVSVISAFGPLDIGKVNLTVVNQNQNNRIALPANQNMTPYLSYTQLSPPPYVYLASWPYLGNSTQGTYQIWIDIVDAQGDIAFSYRGPASFSLVPPGYVPFPYNLIPYLIIGALVGGGGALGGIAFRRRRSRRSYLAPFDHFNNLTGGGLNGGTVVTVEGNTGSGKTLLLEQLMGEDLRTGRPCVFVSTADFPNNVRTNMKTMGMDVFGYEQNGMLTFVDGYSGEAGQESHEKISVPSLGDLTTLGIRLSSAFPSPSFKGGSLYFDSLTPLASKARPESIVSFVQSVGAKVKGLSGKAFFTVGLGIDATVQRQLEDTADCIVQMEAFEESGTRRRRLRIAKFRARKHEQGWVLFTIEEGKGIIFYSKKPKQ